MKTKNLIAVIIAIIMPITSFAAIDLLSLINKTGPIDSHLAKNLLSVCYLHNPQELNNASINVDEIKQINGNTVFLCSVKHNDLPTEYYITTIGNRHGLVVDGAMLGYTGDSKILAIEHPHSEMRYDPEPTLHFDFNGDTVKVIRNYTYFSTLKGGKTFHKEGTITTPFVIGSDGKISLQHISTTALQTTGDANYLSKNRKPSVTTRTSGEFYPPGMNVLLMEQTPASKPFNIMKLIDQASEMMRIVEQYKGKYGGENPPENPETLSVIEFARWSFNQGMRHSNEFLTWIAKHPKKEQSLTRFVLAAASQNENNEIGWIKNNLKNINDKKVRKWWQKWMKENLWNK